MTDTPLPLSTPDAQAATDQALRDLAALVTADTIAPGAALAALQGLASALTAERDTTVPADPLMPAIIRVPADQLDTVREAFAAIHRAGGLDGYPAGVMILPTEVTYGPEPQRYAASETITDVAPIGARRLAWDEPAPADLLDHLHPEENHP